MVTTTTAERPGWRQARRASARDAIVAAAWSLAREVGLAAWSIRDLAARAGITTPTIYAYFESKHAIYDAMFGGAAAQFADTMGEPYGASAPEASLREGMARFMAFCTEDAARYQLLFQRIIPGFEPSAESYAPAVRALEEAGEALAACGVTSGRHRDLWTALGGGLAAQQLSNEPGGDRWTRLADEAVTMFLAHCAPPHAGRTARRTTRSRTTSTRRAGP
jgi:AcrR family transcriptional regulator